MQGVFAAIVVMLACLIECAHVHAQAIESNISSVESQSTKQLTAMGNTFNQLSDVDASQKSAGSALTKALSVTSPQAFVKPQVSDVRAAVIKEVGRSIGLRAGLQDESKTIVQEIEQQKAVLDQDFHFGALILPSGAFPPVIEEARSVISVTDYSMRVAGVVYRILAPARMQSVPPTWRDYLMVGLEMGHDPLIGHMQEAAYPKDEHEAKLWKEVVTKAYQDGRKQAQKIFLLNLGRMERDLKGMRKFYELHARGLVTAPVVVSATQGAFKPDPNTIVIGESVFRITKAASFTGSEQWKVTQ